VYDAGQRKHLTAQAVCTEQGTSLLCISAWSRPADMTVKVCWGATHLAAVGTRPIVPPMLTCMLPCVFSSRVAPEEHPLHAANDMCTEHMWYLLVGSARRGWCGDEEIGSSHVDRSRYKTLCCCQGCQGCPVLKCTECMQFFP
jgi:hypothetical protein